MKEAKEFKHFYKLAGILLLFTTISACEKNKYDLLDPSLTGQWTLFNTSTGLPGNYVGDIICDSKNNLWFTFSGYGAASFTNGTWATYNTANSAILSNYVNCVAETATGSIIFGTINGLSIKASNGQWSSYIDPLATMNVKTIKVTSNKWIWVGTRGQGFYVNDGSGYLNLYSTSFNNVNAIEEDNSGNIYLGTDNGILKWDGAKWTVITTTNGLSSMKVQALFFDSQQRLWIGPNGGQTVSWIDKAGIMHQLSLMNGNVGTFVRDIHEDRKGDIWFATWLDGLICFDGVIPHSYKVYNGFYDDNINSIGQDNDGNLWFGLYYKGLVKYSLPLY